MDEIAIVILNYNGRSFLEQFLPSVLANAGGNPIYVADNNSTDDSIALLQRHFPAVRLIHLAENRGYAGGYNAALEQIRTSATPARYYVLLNSDVEVTPDWLEPLRQLMEAHPQAAACQPKIRSYHQRASFEYAGAAGGYIDYLGYPFCRGRLFDTIEVDTGQYNDECEIFWATGACLFIRADIFHRLGGFDARFFAHMEEVDLCWQIKNAGFQVWYCPRSTVFHVGGGTLHKSNPRKTFLNYRNSLAMLYKNLPTANLILNIFLRLVLDGLSGVRLLLAGQWRDVLAIIQAHFAFYGWLPYLHRQRQELSESRKSRIVHRQIYPHSIVWRYFGRKGKTFRQLKHSEPLPR